MLVVFSWTKLKVETTKSKVTTTVFNNKATNTKEDIPETSISSQSVSMFIT